MPEGNLVRRSEFVCLMYHDLGALADHAGRSDLGHTPYVVSGTAFASQLANLHAQGLKACTVSEALHAGDGSVALTFNNGSSSDIELAAPALLYARFTATFYVVTSRVGTTGYLSRGDLQYMSALGFEIGSHSVTHRFLPNLTPKELDYELRESKDRLEQWIGAPVSHFSCPFGGYTPATVAAALEAGYTTVATSQVGVNRVGATVLRRLAVRRNTSLYRFGRMCRGEALLYPQVRQALLSGVRSIIGFSAYSSFCRLIPHSQDPAEARRSAPKPLMGQTLDSVKIGKTA
jgi:peptidoglycan/xylan/chitin deacetylase (PgdA/CDA1 family)